MDKKEAITLAEKLFNESDYLFDVSKSGNGEALNVYLNNTAGIRCTLVFVHEVLVAEEFPSWSANINDGVKLEYDIKEFIKFFVSYAETNGNMNLPRPIRRYCEYLLKLGGDPTYAALCHNNLLKCERCEIKKHYDTNR